MAFPSSVVAQLQSLGGLASTQRLEVPFFLAGATVDIPLVPTNPYSGIIVHHLSFPDIVPDAFNLRLIQKDIADTTHIVASDEGIEVLAYISTRFPLHLRIQNRTLFDGFFVTLLQAVSFSSLAAMEKAKSLLETP